MKQCLKAFFFCYDKWISDEKRKMKINCTILCCVPRCGKPILASEYGIEGNFNKHKEGSAPSEFIPPSEAMNRPDESREPVKLLQTQSRARMK